MEAYEHSKSRRTNSTKRSGKTPKTFKCRCSYCQTNPSRHAFKVHTQRDLEREYLKSPGGYSGQGRSAQAFVEWFYSPLEEEGEDRAYAEDEGKWEDEAMMGDLRREVGEDVYFELVKEHLLAQEQLDRHRGGGNIKQLEASGMGPTDTHEVRESSQQPTQQMRSQEPEGDWDLVSTATDSDSDAYFEDWEEVTI